jgi:hypothetical protein
MPFGATTHGGGSCGVLGMVVPTLEQAGRGTSKPPDDNPLQHAGRRPHDLSVSQAISTWADLLMTL